MTAAQKNKRYFINHTLGVKAVVYMQQLAYVTMSLKWNQLLLI